MLLKMLVFVVILAVSGTIQTANAQSPVCDGSADLIPHPTVCQRYTNCTKPGPYSDSRLLKDQEDECPYPQLFDINENICKVFKEAVCGPERVASKDPCEYVKNQCGSAHCEPCSSRFPSCVELADGQHAHPSKLWSPYYIECDTERTLGVRICPNHVPTDTIGLYSPVKKACVSVWEIPVDHGGLEPSCLDKEAKMYQVANRPDVYYACPGSRVLYCETGSSFNEHKQVCESTGTS